MKKKIISLLLAAVAVTGALGLAACGGDGGTDKGGTPSSEVKPVPIANSVDTFVGVESSQTYTGELKAVEAFFTDELDGEYVGYENKGALSSSQVKGLKLADEADVKTVHAVMVNYNSPKLEEDEDEERSGVSTSADQDYDSTFKAYVIEYNDGAFKYYSPRPEDGELLTKSYYHSFIDLSKYSRCISTITEEKQRLSNDADFDEPPVYVLSKRVRTETNEVYDDILRSRIESKYYEKVDGEMQLVPDDDEQEEEYSYITKRDGRAYHYDLWDGQWGAEIDRYEFDCGIKYLSGYVNENYAVYADGDYAFLTQILHDLTDFDNMYSYFEKTPTGFKATDELFGIFDIKGKNHTEKTYYFDVDNGKVTDITIKIGWEEQGEQVYEKYTTEIKDLTEADAFSLPTELSDELDSKVQQIAADDAKHKVADSTAWAAAFDYSTEANYLSKYNMHKFSDDQDGDHILETYYSLERNEARTADKYYKYEFTQYNDWHEVWTYNYTYKYNDGGNWFEQTRIRYGDWSEPTQSTQPSTATFAQFGDIGSLYDSFVYDVYGHVYKAAITENGIKRLYIVEIVDGKAVKVIKVWMEKGTAPDGSEVVMQVREDIEISNVGTTVIEGEGIPSHD